MQSAEAVAQGDNLAPFRVDGAIGFWDIAEVRPDMVAIVDADGGETSFGELKSWSNSIAALLIEIGLQPGDTVGLIMSNEPAFLAVQLATSQLGLYLTPPNWHLSASEIEYILSDSDARVVIAGTEFADVATEVADAVGLPADRRFASGAVPGFHNINDLPTAGAVDPARRMNGQTMLYTSGTTGRPKGVRRPLSEVTPEQVLAVALPLTSQRFGWPAGPGSHLVVAPLYHAAPNGFTMMALHYGHTVVLMQKWTPEDCLRLTERYRITASHMVPTMFHRMLALPAETRSAYDLSSLNYVVHAAAPCPVHEKWAMLEWFGPVIYEYYAMTEGGGTSIRPEDWVKHPGTVGQPWDGVDIKVVGPDAQELPAGEVGLIYIRNDDGFAYYKDPQKTADARLGDYFTPGDMGYLDSDGWLFLADRRSDLIISGGVNIYPAEIEAALLEHPAVVDVGIIGLPDPNWGSVVHAAVEPDPALAADGTLADELMAFCREKLAAFKCPKTLEFRDLPRTPTGKLSRSALRREILGG